MRSVFTSLRKKITAGYQKLLGFGFFHLLSANFLIQIVTFASGLIVAGILTPSDIGVIRILQTYIGVFVLLSGLGFNTSTLKLVSEKVSFGRIKGVLFSSSIVTLVVSGIVYCLVVLLASCNLLTNDNTVNKWLPIISVGIPMLALNSLYTCYLQGLKKIKAISYIQSGSKVISIILILSLAYLFKFNGYVVAFLLGLLISTTLFKIVVFNINKKEEKAILDVIGDVKRNWNLARFAFLANVVGYLSSYIDLFSINAFIKDREAVGFYSFATTIILGFGLITTTIQQITFPYFSEKNNDVIDWSSTLKKYGRLNIGFTLAVFIVGVFLVPVLLSYVFKGKYDESIPFFNILLIVWLIKSSYALNGVALMGKGLFNWNLYLAIFTLIIDFVSVYALVSYYGIIGAAIGLLPGRIIGFIVSSIMINKVIRNNNEEDSN